MKKSINIQSASALLGIECGATRTVAFLTTENAAPLRAEFGPANLRLITDAQLVSHFKKICASLTKSPLPLGIVAGLAGARTEQDRQRIRSAAAKVWPNVPCHATNDLETALAAVGELTPGRARVLILSGTGSCCFGRKPDGTTLRFGGWGHILGDRGSGYNLGHEALRTSIHELDVTGTCPPLGQEILRVLQLNNFEELIDWAKSADKTQIASLARAVFTMAEKRDKNAISLLAATAATLASDGHNCARQLLGRTAPVDFVLAGGLFQKQPAFAKRVETQLTKRAPKSTVTVLTKETAWGAIELAKKHFSLAENGTTKSTVSERTGDSAPQIGSKKMSPTEQRNPRSLNLDQISVKEAIHLMAREESKIPRALVQESLHIEHAIRLIVGAFKHEGRLFYVGAGTSGRLGVLDSSEIPPTFRAAPDMVQGIIAGGQYALWSAVEGAEDDASAGSQALRHRGVTRRDVVVGIAASGRTPFVWGALIEAKRIGAKTVLLCFNPHIEIPPEHKPDVVIAPNVGPEILTGSTRLKAGTATKMVLNMLTTLSMVQMGKVLSNLMVDLNASNHKLRERAIRIVREITGADAEAARNALLETDWIVKKACAKLQ